MVRCRVILRYLVLVSLLAARAAAQAQTGDNGRIDRLHAEAKAAEARGDIPAAISSYEAILKLAPRLAAAYNNLGAL